jgi:DNA-binding transcriptional MocR family regulator
MSVSVDLARGHPSTHLLAASEVRHAALSLCHELYPTDGNASHVWPDQDRHPMQYGSDQGPQSIREDIAKWERDFGHKADAGRISLTCGASYGLMNAIQQFTESGYTRKIFMITPAYFLAARIFIDAGFGDCLTAIDELNDSGKYIGPDLQQLSDLLTEDERDWKIFSPLTETKPTKFRYVFYGVPTFSNPSGITWDKKARAALVKLARIHNILVITDEVYERLRYDAQANEAINQGSRLKLPPRLVDFDSPDTEAPSDWLGNCIANCSFSKYLGPGLRVGYVLCSSARMAAQFGAGGANHSGGATSQFTSFLVHKMLQPTQKTDGSKGVRPIDGVLRKLIEVYSARRRTMITELKRHLPSSSLINGRTLDCIDRDDGFPGGYFLWVTVPVGSIPDLPDLLQGIKERNGVLVMPGLGFEVQPNGSESRAWNTQCFRLSFSWEDKANCARGLDILGKAFEANATTQ